MTCRPVVVFDVGSTLIHPNFETLANWLKERTGEIRTPTMVELAFRRAICRDVYVQPGNRDQVEAQTFFGLCGLPDGVDENSALRWWQEIIESGGSNSWLYSRVEPECERTLMQLSEIGCQVVAASNSDGTLEAELRSFDLLKYFDEIFDSSILGVEKPDASFYSSVLRPFHGAFALHIGDDFINDYVAAAGAGFDRALLYDPLDMFCGLPAHVKIRRLAEVVVAMGGAKLIPKRDVV